MLVTPRRNANDQGSALVSVLVMMLVLTLFALTLAAIVSNTTSNLASGKNTGQARAAADAGIAAALAQFRKAQGCTGTLASSTAPRYTATCQSTPDTVTFKSVGSADGGRSITVEAAFHYQYSHEYGSAKHELTFFSDTVYDSSDPVKSAGSDPANLTVISGDYSCSAPTAVNVIVDGDFTANNGCTVDGNITAFGTARVDGTVRGNVTASRAVTVNGSVQGSVAAGTGRSTVGGSVGGSFSAMGPVSLNYRASIGGNLTSASTDRTYLYGSVGGQVKLKGSLLLDYNGRIGGDTVAASRDMSYLYSRISGNFASGGNIYFDNNATVTGDVTVAGTGTTTIYGAIGGNLATAGPVTISYNASVGGAVAAAGTDRSYLYGSVAKDFAVAGAATIDYNGVAKASVFASGTAQTQIYAVIATDVKAGGDVYLPYNGRVRGDLSLPSGRTLSPNDASTRVGGSIRRASAPTPPKAPTVSLPDSEVVVPVPDPKLLFTWQDYGYSAADWPGFNPTIVNPGNSICSSRDWARGLAAFTTATVFDATSCKGGLNYSPTSQTTIAIGTDIVVVSTQINLDRLTFVAAPGTKPHLWFIVPSSGRAVRTDFPGLGRWGAGDGSIELDSTSVAVPTMLYTPRQVNFDSGTFTGSMYASSISVNRDWWLGNTSTTIATPMDFPLSLWGTTGGGGGGSTGGTFSVSPISQREIG